MPTQPEARSRPVVGRSIRAVLCLDDQLRPAVRDHLERLGVRIIGETDRGLQTVSLAGETGAELIVVDLGLTGTLGLRLIPVLLAAAPGTAIVTLSRNDALDAVALKAGARAVVGAADLRGLRAVLGELVAEVSLAQSG